MTKLLMTGIVLASCLRGAEAAESVKVKAQGAQYNHGAEVYCDYGSEQIPIPVSKEKPEKVYLKFWVPKTKASTTQQEASDYIALTISTVIFNDNTPGVNEGRRFDGDPHWTNHEMFVFPGGGGRYLGYSTTVADSKWVVWMSSGDFLLAGPFVTSDEIHFTSINVSGNGDGGASNTKNLRFGFGEKEFKFEYEWITDLEYLQVDTAAE